MVLAAPPTQPTERACLIAWNSPANHANQVKLLTETPVVGLMLRAGVSYTVSWTKTTSKQTGGPACLLTIIKRGRLRLVTGPWTKTGVTQWTFGRATRVRMNYPPADAANVRLLADGRVTKIYRR
jgi:hypothetical protein